MILLKKVLDFHVKLCYNVLNATRIVTLSFNSHRDLTMSKKINTARFDGLVKTAEAYNRKRGMKRFLPIQSRDGRILVFGMYDYVSKKYVLSEPFVDVNNAFDEIEEMLNKA